MRPLRLSAASAFALAALTAAGAFGQQLNADGSIPPSVLYSNHGLDGAYIGDGPNPIFGAGKGGLDCRQADARETPTAPSNGRPRVIATFPADGAVVRPGIVVVRVTFDRPMACYASFYGPSDLPNPCGSRWRPPAVSLSSDGRSFRTVCEVKADQRYRLVLRSFKGAHGDMTIPHAVTFSTSGAAPVATIQEALAEDTGAGMVAGG